MYEQWRAWYKNGKGSPSIWVCITLKTSGTFFQKVIYLFNHPLPVTSTSIHIPWTWLWYNHWWYGDASNLSSKAITRYLEYVRGIYMYICIIPLYLSLGEDSGGYSSKRLITCIVVATPTDIGTFINMYNEKTEHV